MSNDTSPRIGNTTSVRISKEERHSIYWTVDAMLIPTFIFLFAAIFSFHFALTVGDWDYWVDWRDRRWWPLLTPVSLIVLPAVFGYLLWAKLRLPLAGTLSIMALGGAAWLSRYLNFEVFAGFPMPMVAPSTYIALGLLLDVTLTVTRSFILTGAFGGFLFGLLIYPLNWPLMAPYRVPVEMHGTLLTVADVYGFEYIRTAMPEYVRIIEKSTLRTFGGAVTPLTAVFAAFLTILFYYFWTWVGHLMAKPYWMRKLP